MFSYFCQQKLIFFWPKGHVNFTNIPPAKSVAMHSSVSTSQKLSSNSRFDRSLKSSQSPASDSYCHWYGRPGAGE